MSETLHQPPADATGTGTGTDEDLVDGTPAAEVDVDELLLRRLLRAQHEDLAGLPLLELSEGWDNAIWRLGDQLALRLPRRALAARLVAHEQRWLPELAERAAPLEVPVPVRRGEPGDGYPWPWSVIPWIEGEEAGLGGLRSADAPVLAGALRRLHVPAPPEAPANPYRGVALASRRESFEDRLGSLVRENALESTGVAEEALREAFEAAAATTWRESPVWVHGDLHPRNVLVRHGRLAALIDWGDLTGGDPASDLAGVWMLLEPRDRRRFWEAYGGDGELRVRARGWAVLFGAVFLDAGRVDDETFAELGRRTLRRALAEPAGSP